MPIYGQKPLWQVNKNLFHWKGWNWNPYTVLTVRMQYDVVAIENSMAVPQQQQKFKNRTFLGSATLLLGIYPKILQSIIQRDISTPMFIPTLFTVAKYKTRNRCTMEYYSVLKRKCKNEHRGHYATWNKRVAEGQLLHDSTYMRYLKKHIEAKNGMMVPRGTRKMGSCLSVYKFSCWLALIYTR